MATHFRAVDWSFPDSAPDPVNDIHPYPAKFISEIPRHALALTDLDGAVLDPFCGSGTTLVEGRSRLNRTRRRSRGGARTVRS
jgi:DNA modification methylase